ncbi:MAG TPA: MauE/DoxX family redox-associated membrane protein [Chryseolinea sp.]|nr:MauE/DoxX family redox-associated membrane protein [Chryseolinea sp.]
MGSLIRQMRIRVGMRTIEFSLELICGLFIMLFIYAALSKLSDIQQFRVQLGQSPMLTAYAKWVSWFVPAAEIGISILLMIGALRRIGLYAALFLMVTFTTYIFIIMNFSPFVPCSCGGVLENLGWTEHLFFNLVFVAFGIFGILLQYKVVEGKRGL